jgi:hypothetical protein
MRLLVPTIEPPVYITRERSVTQVADAWRAGSMTAAGEIDTCHGRDQGHGHRP